MDLYKKYKNYLRLKLNADEVNADLNQCQDSLTKQPISVGIVGGGISGLYSALLLQHYVPNVNVKIFEANNRVGGRIYTYKFSDEPYQYCEAGAMRIPCSPWHDPVFQLIDYLNEVAPTSPLKLIDFVYSCPSGNRILVNNIKMKDGRVMTTEYADTHCNELGFSSKADIGKNDTAGELLCSTLKPVIRALKADFEEAMVTYNKMSLHQYLINEAGWSEERINYFEVMCGMTNISHAGLIDLLFIIVIQFYDVSTWKTIEGGMSALPELCAKIIRNKGGEIVLKSTVESISYSNDSTAVILGFRDLSKQSSELTHESYDAVIMATPSPCIRMMKERPHWPVDMEYALRSLRHVPVIKILLRFKSQFWERSNLQHPPSLGGASVTDLPSRLIIYPSYGFGNMGKGILIAYIRTDDTKYWLRLTNTEKIRFVLQDLQALYPEVDIANEYAGGTNVSSDIFLKEAYIQDWTTQWSMGTACEYFPAQFSYMYPILAQNRENIYFAGDHLSTNPVFMVGALESTKFAVQQLIRRQVDKDLLIDHFKVGSSKFTE